MQFDLLSGGVRQCHKCGQEKPFAKFPKRPDLPAGVENACHSCKYRQRQASWSPEKRQAERQRARLAKQRGRANLAPGIRSERRRNEPGEVKRRELAAQRKVAALAERAERAIEKKQLRFAEIERQRKRRLAQKPWSDPKLTEAQAWRLRYNLDPEFNLKERLRAAQRRVKRNRYGIKIGDLLRDALKRDGSSPTIEAFFGYTVSDLRNHLQRQFTRGMSWDAFCRGRIHIDHVVPLKSFCLDNEEDWLAAWSLSNLQPLWAKDNQSKAAQRYNLL